MTSKLAGLVFAIALLGLAGCSAECGPNASCPAIAWIGGEQYAIGSGSNLVGVEGALTPAGSIDSANAITAFADRAVFQLGAIDRTAILLARTAPDSQKDMGMFLILWGPNSSVAVPEICRYFQGGPGRPTGCANSAPSPSPTQ